MHSHRSLLAFVFSICAIASAEAEAPSSETSRWKVTLMAEVDGSMRMASAVNEIVRTTAAASDGTSKRVERVTGEAVFLDLGRRRDGGDLNLVVTLRGLNFAGQGWPQTWPYWDAIVPGPVYSEQPKFDVFHTGGREGHYVAPVRGRQMLQPDRWPLLLSFPDVRNPSKAIVAGPAAPDFGNFYIWDTESTGRDVGRQIGDERVKLYAIVVEPTTDPVTHDLPSKLPWISGLAVPASFADERADALNRRTFLLDNETPH